MKPQIARKVLLILATSFALAVAQSGSAQFTFTVNNGTITITRYTGGGGSVKIPEYINLLPVTSVVTYAFYQQTNVTDVSFPFTVTNIDRFAIYNCSGVKSIAVEPDNQKYASVGGVLFDKNVTALIQFPGGFSGSYVVPDTVTNIADSAFQFCSGLSSVALGTNVTSIGVAAFEMCSNLGSMVIPDSVTNVGNYAFSGCSGFTNLVIGHNISGLGDYVFSGCNRVGSLAIPDSVTSIGAGTFLNCGSLTNLTIGSKVVTIGPSAFQDCPGLTSVTIPDSVVNVDNWAFGFCDGLTNVIVGRNVANFGGWVFGYCPNLHEVHCEGNAPTIFGGPGSADTGLFYGELGTVYYVPGTTGWKNVFGGWPTAPWFKPQPQILGTGVRSNVFEFTISWATNTAVVVESSTDLVNWTSVMTNAMVNGTHAVADPVSTILPKQFYRVRAP